MNTGKNLLPEEEPTVIAEKVYNKFALHKFLENSGVISVGDLFGIRLWQRGNNYVALQIVTKGIKSPIKYNVKVQAKPTIKKQQQKLEFKHEEEDLFQ